MKDFILDLDSGIYRITPEGKVFTKSKRRIPIVGKGMRFTGKFIFKLAPERELGTYINNRGYLYVKLGNKTCMVHRLVAEGFCDNPESKQYVNHLDGDKLNNHFSNLEWCTIAENNHHARITGLHKQLRGHKVKYKSPQHKANSLANLKDKTVLTDDQVRYCRQVFVARHPEFSASALAAKYGVSVTAMSNAIRGKTFQNVQ